MTSEPRAIIDVETSGTNPFEHALLAVAIVPLDDTVAPLEVLVASNDVHWSERARAMFATWEARWLREGVSPTAALAQIEGWLAQYGGGRPVTPIGHNVGFDSAFLKQLAHRAGRESVSGLSHRAIDTHTLLTVLADQGRIPESARTSDGAFSHFEIRVAEGARHTALGDALSTRSLYRRLTGLLVGEQRRQVR
jgi:DNA polymerase-3 subunit epsilon